jgi:hypothetical protein
VAESFQRRQRIPYVRKDGEVNPESRHYDAPKLEELIRGIRILSLAYYFVGDNRYSERAFDLINCWFLDSTTEMRPHLQYGQMIPGICDGRGIGLIDT